MLKPSLKVLGGRHDGKLIPIKGKKFLIGREEDCHLRPNSDMVSRHHCVFTVDEYSVRLRDFGSTNGTMVNEKRVKGEVQLTHGDKIQVGKLDFEIMITVTDDKESTQNNPEATTKAPSSGEILTGSDTVFDIPVHPNEDTQTPENVPPVPEGITPPPPTKGTPNPNVYSGDTQILTPEQQQLAQQAYDQAAQQAAAAQQGGYPPQQQYPYPPQQMPPGQQMPPAQQYPYQMPPQYYPQQGYPQQPMPAYPQQYQVPPQQGYPQQQQPPAQANEQQDPAVPDLPPVTLPPPEETGVKEKE